MPLEHAIFVLQSFWKRYDHSVWVKAGLYTFDVGSDWANGILMMQCSDNSTTNGTSSLMLQHSDNSTTNGTASDCHPWWGSATIAMMWLPPALLCIPMLVIVLERISKNHQSGSMTTGQRFGRLIRAPIGFLLFAAMFPKY